MKIYRRAPARVPRPAARPCFPRQDSAGPVLYDQTYSGPGARRAGRGLGDPDGAISDRARQERIRCKRQSNETIAFSNLWLLTLGRDRA